MLGDSGRDLQQDQTQGGTAIWGDWLGLEEKEEREMEHSGSREVFLKIYRLCFAQCSNC